MTRERQETDSATFTHEDPVADQALDWFVNLRNEAPSARASQAFADWLAEDSRHADEFLRLEDMWGAPGFRDAVLAAAPAQSGVFGLRSASRAAGRSAWPRMARAGVAAAAVFMLALGIWQGPHLWRIWHSDFYTVAGEQANLTLPDGSTMILNTASAVAIDFADGRREIRLLEGEAWFGVIPDTSRPFRVTGQYGTVTVTGTKFSLRLGADHDTVVLEEGRVEVAGSGAVAPPVTLEPEQMIFLGPSGLSQVQAADSASALAWRQGRILFDETPLSTVVDELQRYRSGTVMMMNSAVAGMAVSGNYRLDDVETAMRILAETAGLSLTRIPGGIIILR
ncbi:FecR family protein [Rhodobacter sp. 24-YEA-8]|uniref:FecR family protein n=1 Tax=Rhodobacter sp. 24-YEA-8 TaxID=1884310 RepID=UPI000894DF41|nr:FecR family protein [Rhodobacter sp. 24-YEA-8]SED61229.1 FecR family protein [Rhodobacter sp. 24-YEA-8]